MPMATAPPLKVTVPSVGPEAVVAGGGGGFDAQFAKAQTLNAAIVVTIKRCIRSFSRVSLSLPAAPAHTTQPIHRHANSNDLRTARASLSVEMAATTARPATFLSLPAHSSARWRRPQGGREALVAGGAAEWIHHLRRVPVRIWKRAAAEGTA